MEISNLKTREINQNGYSKNTLTKDKIGALFTFPINHTPDDCLPCDGYSLQISDYKELHKIIGTKFNQSGDNAGTFSIPDYNITKRFLQPGDNAGILMEAGLPNLTGAITTSGANLSGNSGVFYSDTSATNRDDVLDTKGNKVLKFDASRSSSVFGKSTTVQPPSQIVHICIKYK